jgi:hypothetical protein
MQYNARTQQFAGGVRTRREQSMDPAPSAADPALFHPITRRLIMRRTLFLLTALAILAVPAVGLILDGRPPAAAQEGESAAVAPMPPPAADQALLDRLQEATGGTARVSYHAYTGQVRFFGTQAGQPLPRPEALAPDAPPEAAARAFLAEYGPLFGLSDQAQELAVLRQQEVEGGRAFMRFQQVHSPFGDLRQGVPVLGGELIIQLDADRNVVSANGELLPATNLPTTNLPTTNLHTSLK